MSEAAEQTQLEALRARCDLMGIKYHPNAKEATLAAKIQAKLDDNDPDEVDEEDEANDPVDTAAPAAKTMPDLSKLGPDVLVPKGKVQFESKEEKQARLRLAGSKLVRVYIHCNNPMKKDWQCEQFTVSNRNLGTINRIVPYDQEWHVEQAILDMMRDRQYMSFTSKKHGPTGIEVKTPKLVKEFNIEILEPLTQKEIKDLAVKQAMQAGDTSAVIE
jgi:hypothetical protein